MKVNRTSKQSITTSRILKVNATSMANREWFILYPEIKLSGQWLERLGFQPGGTIKVTTIENQLLITSIDTSSERQPAQ